MSRTKRLAELINEIETIGEEIGVYRVEIGIGINAKKTVGFEKDKYPFYKVSSVWKDKSFENIAVFEHTVDGVEMFAVSDEEVYP